MAPRVVDTESLVAKRIVGNLEVEMKVIKVEVGEDIKGEFSRRSARLESALPTASET